MKLAKLNVKGFAHWIIPALVVVVIGGIGAYLVVGSHADATSDIANPKFTLSANTKDGCWLAGRKWVNNQCAYSAVGATTACREPSISVYALSNAKVGYCTKAVNTTISKATCIGTYHRLYVQDVGCSRRIDQTNNNDASQCLAAEDPSNPYKNYVAQGEATDHCTAAGTVIHASHPTILIIGDSITARGESPKKYGVYWWKYLQQNTGAKIVLSAQSGSGYLRKGIAGGGQCTGTTFGQRLADVKRLSPDFIIIEGGRNDGVYCNGKSLANASTARMQSDISDYMNAFIKQAAAAGVPASRIYAFTPWGPSARDNYNQVKPVIERNAQRVGIAFVDIPPYGNSLAVDDGIHPNHDGNVYLYNQLTQRSNILTNLKSF